MPSSSMTTTTMPSCCRRQCQCCSPSSRLPIAPLTSAPCRQYLPTVAVALLSLVGLACSLAAGTSCSFLSVTYAAGYYEDVEASSWAWHAASKPMDNGWGGQQEEGWTYDAGDTNWTYDAGPIATADTTTTIDGSAMADVDSIGIFCGEDHYYDDDDRGGGGGGQQATLSKAFLSLSIALGIVLLLLSVGVSTVLPLSNKLWNGLSALAVLTFMTELPILLILESAHCRADFVRCSLGGGSVPLFLSMASYCILAILVQWKEAPDWKEEYELWKLMQRRDCNGQGDCDGNSPKLGNVERELTEECDYADEEQGGQTSLSYTSLRNCRKMRLPTKSARGEETYAALGDAPSSDPEVDRPDAGGATSQLGIEEDNLLGDHDSDKDLVAVPSAKDAGAVLILNALGASHHEEKAKLRASHMMLRQEREEVAPPVRYVEVGSDCFSSSAVTSPHMSGREASFPATPARASGVEAARQRDPGTMSPLSHGSGRGSSIAAGAAAPAVVVAAESPLQARASESDDPGVVMEGKRPIAEIETKEEEEVAEERKELVDRTRQELLARARANIEERRRAAEEEAASPDGGGGVVVPSSDVEAMRAMPSVVDFGADATSVGSDTANETPTDAVVGANGTVTNGTDANDDVIRDTNDNDKKQEVAMSTSSSPHTTKENGAAFRQAFHHFDDAFGPESFGDVEFPKASGADATGGAETGAVAAFGDAEEAFGDDVFGNDPFGEEVADGGVMLFGDNAFADDGDRRVVPFADDVFDDDRAGDKKPGSDDDDDDDGRSGRSAKEGRKEDNDASDTATMESQHEKKDEDCDALETFKGRRGSSYSHPLEYEDEAEQPLLEPSWRDLNYAYETVPASKKNSPKAKKERLGAASSQEDENSSPGAWQEPSQPHHSASDGTGYHHLDEESSVASGGAVSNRSTPSTPSSSGSKRRLRLKMPSRTPPSVVASSSFSSASTNPTSNKSDGEGAVSSSGGKKRARRYRSQSISSASTNRTSNKSDGEGVSSSGSKKRGQKKHGSIFRRKSKNVVHVVSDDEEPSEGRDGGTPSKSGTAPRDDGPAKIVTPEKDGDPDIVVYPSESDYSELSLTDHDRLSSDDDYGGVGGGRRRSKHSTDDDNSSCYTYDSNATEGSELSAVIAGVNRKLQHRITSGKITPLNKRRRRRRRAKRLSAYSGGSSVCSSLSGGYSSHGSLLDEVIVEEGELNSSSEVNTSGDLGRAATTTTARSPSVGRKKSRAGVPVAIVEASPKKKRRDRSRSGGGGNSNGGVVTEVNTTVDPIVSDAGESFSSRAARARRNRIASERSHPESPPPDFPDDESGGIGAAAERTGDPSEAGTGAAEEGSSRDADRGANITAAWRARKVRMARIRMVRQSWSADDESATNGKLDSGGKVIRATHDGAMLACASDEDSI